MSHLPRDAYLVVKSRECPVVAGQWLGQKFQRYGLMEAQVSGAVYLPMPPRPRRPEMRYRPARTVPGTNRPSSKGNGGTSWRVLAGFTLAVMSAVSARGQARGAAHQEQNRPLVLCLLHAGHSMDIDRASFWQRRRLNTNVGGIANVLRRLLLRFRCRAPALHEDFVASYCISR